MPEGIGYGKGDRVAALFAMRLARRRGEMQTEDSELSAFGDSLGLGGSTKPRPQLQAAPEAAPQVATMQTQKDTGIPALDQLSNMPRPKTRGLVHDRKMGRVVKGGM